MICYTIRLNKQVIIYIKSGLTQENQQQEMKKILNTISQKQEESEKNILNDFKDMNISQSSIFNVSGSANFFRLSVEKIDQVKVIF